MTHSFALPPPKTILSILSKIESMSYHQHIAIDKSLSVVCVPSGETIGGCGWGFPLRRQLISHDISAFPTVFLLGGSSPLQNKLYTFAVSTIPQQTTHTVQTETRTLISNTNENGIPDSPLTTICDSITAVLENRPVRKSCYPAPTVIVSYTDPLFVDDILSILVTRHNFTSNLSKTAPTDADTRKLSPLSTDLYLGVVDSSGNAFFEEAEHLPEWLSSSLHEAFLNGSTAHAYQQPRSTGRSTSTLSVFNNSPLFSVTNRLHSLHLLNYFSSFQPLSTLLLHSTTPSLIFVRNLFAFPPHLSSINPSFPHSPFSFVANRILANSSTTIISSDQDYSGSPNTNPNTVFASFLETIVISTFGGEHTRDHRSLYGRTPNKIDSVPLVGLTVNLNDESVVQQRIGWINSRPS
ncbi:hypothetical protein BLNAU_6372 [Blattamonas nauphoetae]|uniref:Uncharacterized protein n=1 Tax=Blattamonas nauphoetae TaxID=2049346 RepID=A0ABQ9Y4D3_9EUKA|nr:hypothetical protein BLNAU_6372 [Blattamonas nauphoetae]